MPWIWHPETRDQVRGPSREGMNVGGGRVVATYARPTKSVRIITTMVSSYIVPTQESQLTNDTYLINPSFVALQKPNPTRRDTAYLYTQ